MTNKMKRLKFQLSSDQLELLLAFETAQGLSHLAEMMNRDPSVVSRNLQRIAEDRPVLKKVRGRWELTPLGIQINEHTRTYLEKQAELFTSSDKDKPMEALPLQDNSALIIINAQNGLLGSTQEDRNNFEAEKNIAKILEHWRNKNRTVVHVKHVSENPGSMFFREALGCDFLPSIRPLANEIIIEKKNSSAFLGTDLNSHLSKEGISSIVLTGFTANECIDATARDGATMGFTEFVVGDATASFDLRDPAGKLVKAERIHKLTLANINAFYAKVVNTADTLI